MKGNFRFVHLTFLILRKRVRIAGVRELHLKIAACVTPRTAFLSGALFHPGMGCANSQTPKDYTQAETRS